MRCRGLVSLNVLLALMVRPLCVVTSLRNHPPKRWRAAASTKMMGLLDKVADVTKAGTAPGIDAWKAYQAYIKREVQDMGDRIDESLGLGPKAAQQVLAASRLPNDDLALIWELSDDDGDGVLSLREFGVAMHLVMRLRGGMYEGSSAQGGLPKTFTVLTPSGGEHEVTWTFESLDDVVKRVRAMDEDDDEEDACERRAGEDDAAYIARLKALAEGWRREAKEIGAEEAKSA